MKIPARLICRLFGHKPGREQDTEPTSYGVRSSTIVCQRCGQVISVILINDGGDHPWSTPR